MDKQEIFDKVAAGIIAQGGPSLKIRPARLGEPIECRYRGENGRKCAAGHLIPDADYRVSFEGLRFESLFYETARHRAISGVPISDEFQALFTDPNAQELIQHLQTAHDWPPEGFQYWLGKDPVDCDKDFLAGWRERMATLAKDHGLSPAVLERLDKGTDDLVTQ